MTRCPYCKSTNVRKGELKRRVNGKSTYLYYCCDCQRVFPDGVDNRIGNIKGLGHRLDELYGLHALKESLWYDFKVSIKLEDGTYKVSGWEYDEG